MRITAQAKKENLFRIKQEALRQLTEKGFAGTTTREIAAAVGMAVGTLFNYFPSKEAMAMALVNESFEAGRLDFEALTPQGEELEKELCRFIECTLNALLPCRNFAGEVLEQSLSPFPKTVACAEGEHARLEHMKIVRGIVRRHGFSPTINHMAMSMYWSMYLGVLAFWCGDESENRQATRSVVSFMVEMLLRMMRSI